jgi:hypothetical protein
MWESALTNTQQGNFEEIRRIEGEITQEKRAQDNIIASLGKLTNEEMIQRAQANYEASSRRIAMLQTELDNVRMIDRRETALTRARPAMIKIITHWQQIPGTERRNIFQEFAEFIHISRVSRASKQVTVHWRDGSTSERSIAQQTAGFLWEDEDLVLLNALIERQAPQHEILRAFPTHTWRQIRDRWRYHFSEGRRFNQVYNVFGGKKRNERRYGVDARWQDTEEYKAMMSHDAELESSPSVHHHADDGEHAATLTETSSVGASIDLP